MEEPKCSPHKAFFHFNSEKIKSEVTRILTIIVQTTNMLAVIKAGKPE
jgi:hypothetical protein